MSKTKTDLGPYDEAKVAWVMRLTKVQIEWDLSGQTYKDEDEEHVAWLARRLLSQKLGDARGAMSTADKYEVRRRSKEKYHALNKEGKYVEAQLWERGGGPIGWSWRPPGTPTRGPGR
jgi:hypothetical protein